MGDEQNNMRYFPVWEPLLRDSWHEITRTNVRIKSIGSLYKMMFTKALKPPYNPSNPEDINFRLGAIILPPASADVGEHSSYCLLALTAPKYLVVALGSSCLPVVYLFQNVRYSTCFRFSRIPLTDCCGMRMSLVLNFQT
jgi:hypothetical protein